MLKIKAILLMIVFVSNLLLPLYPFLEYALNKDYIKKVLCINKDKPQSTCNGKCHLNKQIKKFSESDQDDHKTSKKFMSYKRLIDFYGMSIILKELNPNYKILLVFINSGYKFLYSSSLFHPPNN